MYLGKKRSAREQSLPNNHLNAVIITYSQILAFALGIGFYHWFPVPDIIANISPFCISYCNIHLFISIPKRKVYMDRKTWNFTFNWNICPDYVFSMSWVQAVEGTKTPKLCFSQNWILDGGIDKRSIFFNYSTQKSSWNLDFK